MAEKDTSQFPSNTKRREPREYENSLYNTDYHDWKLFMWLASLKEIKDMIYLFIVFWDAVSLRNVQQRTQELINETSEMIQLIEELASLKALNDEQKELYNKDLSEYKDCRLNEASEIRSNFGKKAWRELIGSGLPSLSSMVADKLNISSISQKTSLRMMIFSRMDSFITFAKQIQTKNQANTELGDGTSSVQKEINNVTTNVSSEISESEINRLEQENVRLKAKLGEAIDPEWRDRDENNSTQLVEDIESLNRALNKITEVKRAKIINKDAVMGLFSSFNCTTDVEDSRMLLVLDAALKQHLIGFILKSADDYFNVLKAQADISEDKLEAVILSKTEDLIELTTRFENTFLKTEDRKLSTKLRKQSYATFGHRVFSNSNHIYIKELTRKLMDEMDKYRILESEEKNKKLEKKIVEIIIKVLQIFRFRLKTQEPIPRWKFYKSGEGINPEFMEGTWDGHHEDYEVEICSFPVVYTESDGRVYTKAKVIERSKNA